MYASHTHREKSKEDRTELVWSECNSFRFSFIRVFCVVAVVYSLRSYNVCDIDVLYCDNEYRQWPILIGFIVHDYGYILFITSRVIVCVCVCLRKCVNTQTIKINWLIGLSTPIPPPIERNMRMKWFYFYQTVWCLFSLISISSIGDRKHHHSSCETYLFHHRRMKRAKLKAYNAKLTDNK